MCDVHLRNVLEWRLDPACPHGDPELVRRDRVVIVVCDEGYQSSLAPATLRRFGLDAADVVLLFTTAYADLARHYGDLLPYPATMVSGGRTERLNGEDGMGAIYPPMANTVMMYEALGKGPDFPPRAVTRKGIDKLLVIGEHEAYCQPCVSPVWDTALALEDGTLLLESDEDIDLNPFADALEGALAPPYRVTAVRKGESTWAVAANSVEVTTIADEIEGDTVELAYQQGETTVLVDGTEAFGSLASFEQLAEGLEAYVIRASRLDGDLWEVKVTPL